MRIGVKVGPVYASTSTRRRRKKSSGGGAGATIGLLAGAAAIFWPLALGNKPHGGHYAWVWAIAIPWWVLCALVLLAVVATVIDGKKKKSQ